MERLLSVVDTFKSADVPIYIKYCSKPQPEWNYLEEPMWSLVINKLFDISDVFILDVGTGAGRLYELLIKLGANPEMMLAMEPNLELAKYLSTEKHIPTILGDGDGLSHHLMQHGEIGLVTANMVVNHMTTDQYARFVKFTRHVVGVNGIVAYTTPYSEGKARKHKIDNNDNEAIVEEPAPWGGTVKYHHRSDQYQLKVLEKNGFVTDRFLFGYEDFISEKILRSGERSRNKSLRGYKREMFISKRVK